MPVIIDGTLGVNAAAITTTNWTPTNITTGGNTTLGDASSDTVTINASTVSIPNSINFDSNTLFIDAANDKVGVGIASSLGAKLDVRNASATTALRVYANDTTTAKIVELKSYDNTLGEVTRMIVQANGNVGIGTTDISQSLNNSRLTVYSTAVSGKQTLSGIDRTTANWVRFVNPQYSSNASMGLLLKVFPDTDASNRQGAGLIASGGANNGCTDLSAFVSYSADATSSTSYAAYTMTGLGDHIWNRSSSLELMRANGNGNLAIGNSNVVSWDSQWRGIQLNSAASISARWMNNSPYSQLWLSNNLYRATDTSSGDLLGWKTIAGHYGSAIAVGLGNGGDTAFFSQNWTAAGSDVILSEMMRINSAGNLGVGTNSPATRIHATGTILAQGAGGNTAPSGVAVAGLYSSGTSAFFISGYGTTTAGSYAPIIFQQESQVGSAERMRIDAAGNVGIYTTAPEFKLDIGNSVIPFRSVVTNPGGHAVNSGYIETRSVGLALGTLETAWITKSSVSSSGWIVKFTGVWENNYEGGGLTPPPSEVYVHMNYPYVAVGSLVLEVVRDSSSGRLYVKNNSGSYVIHFTGEIEVTSSPQSGITPYTASHTALNLSSNNGYSAQGMSGGLILNTPCYSEYQFRWSGAYNHTTTLTCGSYACFEIIFTCHQTNSGTDNNEYVRGKWANNYTSHIWTEFEHSGNIDAMTTSFTVSQNNTGDSGKLIIQETYQGSGLSYSLSNLIVRAYYGGFSISHT